MVEKNCVKTHATLSHLEISSALSIKHDAKFPIHCTNIWRDLAPD